MPRATKTDRQTREVVGCLLPDALYTTAGAFTYAALGEDELSKGRVAKVIHPIRRGNFLYYEGRELIEWIRTTGKPSRRAE